MHRARTRRILSQEGLGVKVMLDQAVPGAKETCISFGLMFRVLHLDIRHPQSFVGHTLPPFYPGLTRSERKFVDADARDAGRLLRFGSPRVESFSGRIGD